MKLTGAGIQKPVIKVFGIFGSFTVGSKDAKRVHVRYFSTVASGADSAAAGNSLSLLRELKPMRERVRVSDLRDLAGLLQRELDDGRVATELVPYLKGTNSQVGFFPGILVALVPHGFLMQEKNVEYPIPGEPQSVNGAVAVRYGSFWTAGRFTVGTDTISLGTLEIDPKMTDLIVLDGQHRANAFRYATGTFDAVQSGDSIYQAFYEGVDPPDSFDAELPVTIVWFEADDAIEPTLISRKLFVDVNTNAKPVSESRNVLLDDRNRASIVTGSLYRLLARRAFDADVFSLLHAGFDCEEKQQHPLTMLLPSTVQYALSYAAFGRDEAVGLDYTIPQDWWRYANNYARLRSISAVVDEADFRAAETGDREAFERTVNVLDKEIAPKLLGILEGFPMSIVHVKASADLDSWLGGQAVMLKEVWDKVYRGGEGLYGGFARAASEGRAHNYKKAIEEISAKFLSLRRDGLAGCSADQVSRAYETLTSKAGITGLLMAGHNFCSIQDTGWAASDRFVEALKKLSAENWVRLLADYKPGVIKEVNPRLWTYIRNIVVRALQGVVPELAFFKTDVAQAQNPDVVYVRNHVNQQVDSYRRSLSPHEQGVRPDAERMADWCTNALASLKQALSGASLSPIHADDVLLDFAQALIEKLLPIASGPADDDSGMGEPEPE
jgi:hypothetical protein